MYFSDHESEDEDGDDGDVETLGEYSNFPVNDLDDKINLTSIPIHKLNLMDGEDEGGSNSAVDQRYAQEIDTTQVNGSFCDILVTTP